MKRALRAEATARRARLGPGARAALSRLVAARAEEVDWVRDARTLAVYAAVGAEVDPADIVGRARARGARIVYPRARAGDRLLELAPASPDELVPGPFGCLEPPPAAPAVPLAEVDCVLVPGVAFSASGVRLGRGGGHYDATLAAMPRARRIGLAFEVQVVPALPLEDHDAVLDALVTDARTVRFARDSG